MREIRLDIGFGLVLYKEMTCRCQQPAGQKQYPNHHLCRKIKYQKYIIWHPGHYFRSTLRMELGNVTVVQVSHCTRNELYWTDNSVSLP